MQMQPIFKYYRVYQHQTAITEVSVNDFKPPVVAPFNFSRIYSLPPERQLFRDYANRVEAMEQAKAGALAYIHNMTLDVELAIAKLVKYRNDHHEDLNLNLLDANIRKFKKQMYIK